MRKGLRAHTSEHTLCRFQQWSIALLQGGVGVLRTERGVGRTYPKAESVWNIKSHVRSYEALFGNAKSISGPGGPHIPLHIPTHTRWAYQGGLRPPIALVGQFSTSFPINQFACVPGICGQLPMLPAGLRFETQRGRVCARNCRYVRVCAPGMCGRYVHRADHVKSY